MSGQIQAARDQAGFKSNDQLAKQLKEDCRSLFDIGDRSLGTKIGELDRGVETWWRNRPEQTKALAAALDLTPEDLLSADASARGNKWVTVEFPELPPVDLEAEELPVLTIAVPLPGGRHHTQEENDTDIWLQCVVGPDYARHPLVRPHGISWLRIPTGYGRHLLLERVKRCGIASVAQAPALNSAIRSAPRNRMLVLAPEEQPTPSDIAALSELPRELPVLIVSAYDMPLDEGTTAGQSPLPHWRWLAATTTERRRLDLANPRAAGLIGMDATIKRYQWRLVPGWRRALLKWSERMLGAGADTLFTEVGVGDWLDKFDPEEAMFSTPSAVLALARLCHIRGERKLPQPTSPEAGADLAHSLGTIDSRTQTYLSELITSRWSDARHAWDEPLAWSQWEESLQMQQPPEPAHVRARPPRGQHQSDHLARAQRVLEKMRSEEFLTPTSQGLYAFKSPAISVLLLRDALCAAITGGALQQWAAPALGDPRRQALLDAILASMDPRALQPSIDACGKLPAWSASAISGSEVLFIAIGRVLAAGHKPSTRRMTALLDAVVSRAIDVGSEGKFPLTREASPSSRLYEAWIQACWQWSLFAPNPHALPNWLKDQFPGWKAAPLDWEWVTRLERRTPGEDHPDSHTPPVSYQLFQTARRVIADRMPAMPRTPTQPSPLVATLILTAPTNASSKVTEQCWHTIAPCTWARDFILRALEGVQLKPRIALVYGLIAAVASPSYDRNLLILMCHPLWRRMLQEPQPRVGGHLDGETATRLVAHIQAMPPWLQDIVVRKCNANDRSLDWASLLRGIDSIPSGVCEKLLASTLSNDCIAELWRTDPECCYECASNSQHPASRQLIMCCPADQTKRLAQQLVNNKELLSGDHDRSLWISRHLGVWTVDDGALRSAVAPIR